MTRAHLSVGEVLAQFQQFLHDAGLDLSRHTVTMDGRWRNVPLLGHRRSARSGGYMGYLDRCPEGFFRNHRTGEHGRWLPDIEPVSTTEAERQRLYRQQRAERERRQEALRHAARSLVARALFDKATDASPDHSYLVRKQVPAIGIRQLGRQLLVPLSDADGQLWSVQFIEPDGAKRLLAGARKSGLFCMLGTAAAGSMIGLAEGYATAATVHQALAIPVAMAIDAGNLAAAARSIRSRYPASPILVAGDNDACLTRRTPPLPNVGLEKAMAAAGEVGGVWAVPPQDGDWNDFRALHGLQATRRALRTAAPL